MASLVQHLVPDWPAWSLNYLLGTSAAALACFGLQFLAGGEPRPKAGSDVCSTAAPKAGFRSFQLRYLAVYLLVMLADWLQGTNMYTLYTSYGVDTASLFLTGFLSSALFGTVLGLFVDDYGRRRACIVFCALEVVINLLEHVPHMGLLLVGRILGGLSTSLLFTSFESWMVSEHRREGYPEEQLESTFALASTGNGVMAIIAGLSAQVAADALGEIGPFQVAIALTVAAWALIAALWGENKAERAPSVAPLSGLQTLRRSVVDSWQLILERPAIAAVGLSQALFEGAMYTFVFNWVPTLMAVSPTRLPTGLVFSSFMVSVTAGGMLYTHLRGFSAEATTHLVFLASGVSMAVAAMSRSLHPTMVSFLVFEGCIGVSFACMGVLRSKYIPESHMASILNLFRLPLNALVVVGTKLSDLWSVEHVFWVCAAWHVCASAVLFAGLALDRQRKIASPSAKKTK